ncbi:MAG: hypothetical protein CSA58_02650 [Micrococcales bacterium]|nr:MAG: hypothetical protein CSB46_01655 [Micrococcales bacterium]PIE27733.1 MAG: hypothetical protein CSA58_02650 [Micrococcales bacterium]
MTGLTYNLAMGALAVAATLFLIRLFRGPTNADRIIALDSILVAVVGGVSIELARTGSTRFAPILVALSMLAFLGTTAVARFLERLAAPATEQEET